MQWLLVFLGGILQKLFQFFIKRYVYRTSVFLAWAAFTVGLYITFLTFVKISMSAISVAAPAGVSFAIGLFPGIVFDMATLYLTILIAKRVYDWKQSLGKSYYITKGMSY